MATTKPRITVTLENDVYETVKGMAEAQGCSMSAVVSELLTAVNPAQKRVLKAVQRAASSLTAKQREETVHQLERAEQQISLALEPIMGLLDEAGAAPQPPHSNTGVTTPNPPTRTDPKKPANPRRTKATAITDAEWQKEQRKIREARDMGLL